MNSTLIGCIRQTEADNNRRKMKEIITKILDANQDINMASEYARKYLAEQIEKEVKQYVDKMFMEEYEMIIKPSTSPF